MKEDGVSGDGRQVGRVEDQLAAGGQHRRDRGRRVLHRAVTEQMEHHVGHHHVNLATVHDVEKIAEFPIVPAQ